MLMIRGMLEILQMANGNDPKSFNDFTKIQIGKGRLSSATISKRLDGLIAVKAIQEVVIRSKAGRRIIAYKTTEKGRRAIKLASELEEEFAIPKAK
jgi:DNA-binding HxlR family transcriptional regulator